METLLTGITAQRVPTDRLTVAVLSVAGRTGPAVLFVHGNVSSSLFWQPAMLALPETSGRSRSTCAATRPPGRLNAAPVSTRPGLARQVRHAFGA